MKPAAANVAGMRRRVPAKRDATARQAGGAPVEGAADAGHFAHYADEGEGLTMSPATVLTMSLVFIGVVVLLHVFGGAAMGKK